MLFYLQIVNLLMALELTEIDLFANHVFFLCVLVMEI